MDGRILKGPAGQGAILRHDVIDAATEARSILEQARTESERIRSEAREQGFCEGFSQWEGAVRQAQEQAAAYNRQYQQELLRLSVRVAEKILGDTLRQEPERLLGLVQEALRNLSRERRLTIEVAPGQAAILETNRASLEARLGPDCMLRIVESTDVRAGGCLLRSELGAIDARVETQLALIERTLLRESGGSTAETGR